ncbi:uncharacterized protein BDW70DRAFT_69682 [Aspergillus foveolatus]|uniref:uncharacterized protein n=1 Tax=Aspergillus foveolatus TaxID=210207 RepID=UPI003CCD4457
MKRVENQNELELIPFSTQKTPIKQQIYYRKLARRRRQRPQVGKRLPENCLITIIAVVLLLLGLPSLLLLLLLLLLALTLSTLFRSLAFMSLALLLVIVILGVVNVHLRFIGI